MSGGLVSLFKTQKGSELILFPFFSKQKRHCFAAPRKNVARSRATVTAQEEREKRLGPCSVDFGRETPKFWFENLRWIFGWIFSSCFFPRKKARKKKSTAKNPPAKFTRDFVQINSPRISADAFSLALRKKGEKRGELHPLL